MPAPSEFAIQRVGLRHDQLGAIERAGRRHGATALHLTGSLGRGAGDALSDIDVWLTFPDEKIELTIANRRELFDEIGDLLLVHEMAPNRPPGGVFALALYATAAGPMEIDWVLAPQSVSRVDSTARAIFVDVPIPVGSQPLDLDAVQEENLGERVTWLIAMLFVAAKMVARGGTNAFLPFLGEIYRDIGETYGIEGIATTDPVSVAAISAMPRQLGPYADGAQRRALDEIREFVERLRRETELD